MHKVKYSFIAYTKAFDNVVFKVIRMLKDITIGGKDLKIINNIHWKQVTAIKTGNKAVDYAWIKQGIRQEYVDALCHMISSI